MARFRVRFRDGRDVSIEAPDAATAARLARASGGATMSASSTPAGERGTIGDTPGVDPKFADPDDSLVRGVGKGVMAMADTLSGQELPPSTYTPANTQEQTGKTILDAATMFTPSPAGGLLRLETLARSPWLVRALVGAGVTGAKDAATVAAQKGTKGQIALAGGIGAAGGTMMASAPALEKSAVKNIVRATGARGAEAENVREVAPHVLGIGDAPPAQPFVGGRERLTRLATERATAGQRAGEIAGAAEDPLSLRPAIEELQERASKIKNPIPEPPLPVDQLRALAALPGPAKPGATSVREAALRQLGITEDQLQQYLAQADLPKSGDMPGLNAMQREIKELENFEKAFPEGAPRNLLTTHRLGTGRVTRRGGGYERLPGDMPAAEVEAKQATGGALTGVLHDPATGGGPQALGDQQYHVYKTLETALKKSGIKDLTQTAQDHFLRYIVARAAIGGALGGLTASGEGRVSPMVGIVGGGILGAASSAPLMQSFSAHQKVKLAEAINSGAFAVALNMIQAKAREVAGRDDGNSLPRAPEE